MQKENRRDFITKLSAMTAAIMVPLPFSSCSSVQRDKFGELLPQRLLGSTGDKITMMGVGGWHAGQIEEAECERVIEKAIESGIRLFDTARIYQDGISEERYGKYLTPKYRDNIFLFSKTHAKDAKTAREHLESSLRSLKTDHLDLWYMHMVASPEDIDERLENEVLEVMIKAKEEGKTKHIGFTGHRSHIANSYILNEQNIFASSMMPINVADFSYESFSLNVIPKLIKQNYGIMAMKTLAGGGLFGADGETGAPDTNRSHVIPNLISPEEALHFVWSLPVSAIISGTRSVEELEMNINAARSFVKMEEAQRNKLIDKVAELGSTGEMEWYKAKK